MRWAQLCLLLLQLVGSYMCGNKSSTEYYNFSCVSGAGGEVVRGQNVIMSLLGGASYNYLHDKYTRSHCKVFLKFIKVITVKLYKK